MVATTAGGLTSALLFWLLSGLLAPLAPTVRLWVFVVLAALVLLVGHGFVGLRLPQNRQQIPRSVFDRSPTTAAARFGYELGTGLRTYLPSAAPHLLAVGLVVLGGPWWAAVALGVGFGLGRGLLPTQRALAPDARRWDARVDLEGPVVRGGGEVLALVGLVVAALLRV